MLKIVIRDIRRTEISGSTGLSSLSPDEPFNDEEKAESCTAQISVDYIQEPIFLVGMHQHRLVQAQVKMTTRRLGLNTNACRQPRKWQRRHRSLRLQQIQEGSRTELRAYQNRVVVR